jgi:hypothetical protein
LIDRDKSLPVLFLDEVEQRQKERSQKEAKDSRNLYLAREGIIREGTKVSTNYHSV